MSQSLELRRLNSESEFQIQNRLPFIFYLYGKTCKRMKFVKFENLLKIISRHPRLVLEIHVMRTSHSVTVTQ